MRSGCLQRMQTALLLALMIVCLPVTSVRAEEVINHSKADDIVIVLDVSGSMKSNDTERLSFETIELLMNVLDERDRIAVVAFNEKIVYQSELIQVGNLQEMKKMQNQLNTIPYSGDTDNGMGMQAGMNILLEADRTDCNKAIIFISDGKTDLPDGEESRTVEESIQDMANAEKLAKENQIPIYTLGFSTTDTALIDELTAISTATGGSSHVCAGPLQMMNTVMDIAMLYKDSYESRQMTVKPDENLQTYELEIEEESRNWIIFQSSTELEDFEVIFDSKDYTVYESAHCRIIKPEHPIQGKMALCYRANQPCNAIINCIRFLSQQPSPVINEIKVPEIDKISPTAAETLRIPARITVSKQDQVMILIIGIIVAGTIFICGGIIFVFFFLPKDRRKPEPVLQGILHAKFIDLKSKNELPDMTWNLRECPQEGVTLKELFESAGIQEDLPQLHQICLYPDDNSNGMLLVHCIEGGIFIDDRNISMNVPAHVQYGETIYVAFPENASEISIQYQKPSEA